MLYSTMVVLRLNSHAHKAPLMSLGDRVIKYSNKSFKEEYEIVTRRFF